MLVVAVETQTVGRPVLVLPPELFIAELGLDLGSPSQRQMTQGLCTLHSFLQSMPMHICDRVRLNISKSLVTRLAAEQCKHRFAISTLNCSLKGAGILVQSIRETHLLHVPERRQDSLKEKLLVLWRLAGEAQVIFASECIGVVPVTQPPLNPGPRQLHR